MPNCRGQNSFFVQEFYFSCCSRTILIHLMVLKWIYHSFYSLQFSSPGPDACKYILTGEGERTQDSDSFLVCTWKGSYAMSDCALAQLQLGGRNKSIMTPGIDVTRPLPSLLSLSGADHWWNDTELQLRQPEAKFFRRPAMITSNIRSIKYFKWQLLPSLTRI